LDRTLILTAAELGTSRSPGHECNDGRSNELYGGAVSRFWSANDYLAIVYDCGN
jgi:hypothetical protein